MNLRERIIKYGIITATSLSLIGCGEKICTLYGKVEDERVERNEANPYIYSFSFRTDYGLAKFSCAKEDEARALNELINVGDVVGIKAYPSYIKCKETDFWGSIEHIASINGKKLRR